jgi:hypothetical protein
VGLVTEYPAGFLFLCVLAGAVYAGILYYRDIRNGLPLLTHRLMLVFRFLAVTLIAFLLLGPMIRQTGKLVEKPVVILGIDNSRSLILTSDSDYYRSALPGAIAALTEELQKKCEVQTYSFGDKLERGFGATFSGVKTDISSFLNEVNTRFSNRNAAALILFSDGIYNDGTDPFYASNKIPFPVYAVALGDTMVKKDVLIRKIMVNKTAYKGDKFPVEALIEMNRCSGATAKVTLSQGSQILETREIKATSDRTLQKVTFMLEAKKEGIVRYLLNISTLEGEGSVMNNTAGFIVEVLDSRQKIALVYNAPHPDIFAIRKGLEGSSRFTVELLKTDQLPPTFEGYDLVILNQLPSLAEVANLGAIFRSKVSLLIIVGSKTDINTLNNLKTGLVINSSRASFNESQPVVNEGFSMFTMDQKELTAFQDFPPLLSPFGTYQLSPMTEVLFYQKIDNIVSRIPLIMFTRVEERKIGFIAGENIWRWRIANYIQQSEHESFDLLIDKIAMYLATREDKSFFRIHMNSRISENQPVEIDAEVFNASYELINDPEVSITITDRDKKSFPFVFSKTPKAYYLNAGMFPVGEYTYNASVRVGPETYSRNGKFFVEPVNVESANLVADHGLLYRIAAAHDGSLVYRSDLGTLAEKILARDDIRPVATFRQRMTDLIGNPWLFVMILALLTAEWVIRKREGL